MPNVGQVLKEEMARVSRREIKKAIGALQRSSAAYRREIAALKRHIALLERTTKNGYRAVKNLAASGDDSVESSHRFSAQGLRSLRQRLNLSASQLGTLLGVSEQSVYNWERKVATPRAQHLTAIVQLRRIGKREVSRLLERQQARAK